MHCGIIKDNHDALCQKQAVIRASHCGRTIEAMHCGRKKSRFFAHYGLELLPGFPLFRLAAAATNYFNATPRSDKLADEVI